MQASHGLEGPQTSANRCISKQVSTQKNQGLQTSHSTKGEGYRGQAMVGRWPMGPTALVLPRGGCWLDDNVGLSCNHRNLGQKADGSPIYIYIYIYVCVCVRGGAPNEDTLDNAMTRVEAQRCSRTYICRGLRISGIQVRSCSSRS